MINEKKFFYKARRYEDNKEVSNALVNICYGDVYEWNKDWTGFRAKNWQDIKQFLMKGENKTIDDKSRVGAAVT